jgi:hypothetical protein
MKVGSSRREFVGSIMAALISAGRGVGLSAATTPLGIRTEVIVAPDRGNQRAKICGQIRKDAALANSGMPIPANHPNSDEHLYPTKPGSYNKGLPHNELGEVDLRAYQAMLRALDAGHPGDFEKIRLGGNIKLSNPQGGLAFDLEACDSHQTFMAAPPALASAWRAGEMVENYWMALPGAPVLRQAALRVLALAYRTTQSNAIWTTTW